MITLAQDAAEVRRLLGGPKQQKPSFDDIVSALIGAIQFMTNRANGTGKAWTDHSVSVTSVADTAEYALTPAAGATFGRALFVYRDLDNNVLVPVPFTDFTSELNDQRYQFWLAPIEAGEIPVPMATGEKIAFWRQGGLVRMRIFPIPEAARTYVIRYASGALDWSTFEWTDVPAFPEFSHLRQAIAARAVVARAEWEGYARPENKEYRAEIRGELERTIALEMAEFTPFLRNPQIGPAIAEVGYWWE